MNRIMRDLLQFARPKADTTDPGSVEAAINDTVTLVSPQKEFDAVDLSLDVFPDLPRVKLTQERLVQVLLNLMLNTASGASWVSFLCTWHSRRDSNPDREIENLAC